MAEKVNSVDERRGEGHGRQTDKTNKLTKGVGGKERELERVDRDDGRGVRGDRN